jgi:hypothetical protein
MGMAATPEESGGPSAPGRGPRVPFDEARLLTVGQAADLLGVAHVTLRQWVRAGRIATHLGRTGGLEVDLVRAGDLAALDPRVRQRSLPETAGGDPVAGSNSARTGRQRAEASERRLVLAAEVPTAGGTTSVDWSSDLARELERLRAELAEERARGRARAVELEAVERDLRRLLGRTTDQPARCAEEHAAHAVPIGGAALAAHRPRQGLPLLALLPALVLGFVARPWLTKTPEIVHSAAGSPIGATGAVATSGAPTPVFELVIGDESAPERTELSQPWGSTDAPPVAPASTADGDRVALAPALDFVGRLTARELRPLAYTPVSGPVCAFGGQPLDLGPCMGPPTLAGDGVAGTHRVDGVDCCRHHQLAQRLGGDVAQLATMAELARQEGVLPPLVAARIDRAVGQFLRARFGAWRAAGVDEAQGEGHHVQVDAQGVATVETWIELEQPVSDGAAPAAAPAVPSGARRDLRLVLEVSDGADGDVLLELVTLARSTDVAAGGALAVPDAERSTSGSER